MVFQEAADDFLRFCTVERQLSPHTLSAYRADLSDFCARLGIDRPVTDVTIVTLKGYLSDMVSTRKLAVATVRRRLACLRAFFKRQADQGLIQDPFVGWRLQLPRRKRLPRALSRIEVSSLLRVSTKGGLSRSDRILNLAIRLMIETGMRVGELSKLRLADLSPDASAVRIHGKGSRDRVAYITDAELRHELLRLVGSREKGGTEKGALFLNRDGSPLRPQSIRVRLRRYAERLGLARRVTPHMLRHTAATLLIETGVDIRFVQRLLGHSSIATTEIYTHVSDEALRSTLERAAVLSSIR
jgi:integrase/recombinase XerD